MRRQPAGVPLRELAPGTRFVLLRTGQACRLLARFHKGNRWRYLVERDGAAALSDLSHQCRVQPLPDDPMTTEPTPATQAKRAPGYFVGQRLAWVPARPFEPVAVVTVESLRKRGAAKLSNGWVVDADGIAEGTSRQAGGRAVQLRDEPTATGTEARVCADIAQRQALGLAKYGTTVEANPLTLAQWLRHAYEETLDKAIYLRRALEELERTAGEAHPRMACAPTQALRADDILAAESGHVG